jgi:heat shock protein 4
MAGPIVQRHFEKVENERIAEQERLEAKRQAEEEARKAAEAEKAANAKDEEMTDAEASRPEGEADETK